MQHTYRASICVINALTQDGCWNLAFGALGAIFVAALPAVGNTLSIQGAAHNVVTHTREVFHPTTANQHHTVLLQVVPLTADIRRDFKAIGKADTRHFAQSRVRLFGRRGVHTSAHSALLRTGL